MIPRPMVQYGELSPEEQEAFAKQIRRFLLAMLTLFERQLGITLDMDIQVTFRPKPR